MEADTEPLPDPVPLTGYPYKRDPCPLYERMTRFPFQVLAESIGLPPQLARRFDRDCGKVVQPFQLVVAGQEPVTDQSPLP
ncbi:hypothetical protein GCM10010211_58480 [Streptomyces albospinus]|uniref:Uncharacterized protein n=1 Tax=Streptomyces albospinus TaxID=285515 RepID=A0ABQ2VHU1_9ACTN|nr:hypothetical protein [Streptomyces albospinus]GGU84780.1 hypothetical protein GCM10010211_58480 [Streptomyces albospinus]